jgi:tRNA A37 threonylcarbamoyladenosine dehydratase
MTLHSNIGKSKVDVWEERIKDINPECDVIKVNEFITKENIDILFKYKIDYIIIIIYCVYLFLYVYNFILSIIHNVNYNIQL